MSSPKVTEEERYTPPQGKGGEREGGRKREMKGYLLQFTKICPLIYIFSHSSYLRSSRSGEHQIGPSGSSKRQGIAQRLMALCYKQTEVSMRVFLLGLQK